MADERWQMPRRWPFDAVELTPGGLVLHLGWSDRQTVPWRMIRAIERPGGGVAVLVLGDGDAVELPDRSADDPAWMDRIAAHAAAAAYEQPTHADYEAVALAFIDRYGAVHACVKEQSGLVWSSRFGAAVHVAGALGLFLYGALWASLALVPFAAVWLSYALMAPTLEGPLAVREFRVGRNLVQLTGATGRGWSVPLDQLRVTPQRVGGVTVAAPDGERLWMARGPGADALVALVRAVWAVERGGFAGIAAQPPSAASISRITGHDRETADRGISLAAADREGEDA